MTLAKERGVWPNERHGRRSVWCDSSRASMGDRSIRDCVVQSRRASVAHVGRRRDIG